MRASRSKPDIIFTGDPGSNAITAIRNLRRSGWGIRDIAYALRDMGVVDVRGRPLTVRRVGEIVRGAA